MITRSPVTAAKPRRSAAPLPPLRGWRSSTKPCSFCSRSRISRRAVGRHVVDDDQLDAHPDGEHALDDLLDRVALVEDRHHDREQRVGRHARRGALRASKPGGVMPRWAGAADGEQRQADRRRDDAFERQRPRRDEPVEQADLARGVLGVAADVEVVHPPEQPDRVRVPASTRRRGRRRRTRRSASASSSAGGGRARRRAGRRSAARPARRSAPCRWCRRRLRGTGVSAWTSSSMCSSTLTQTIVSKRSALQIGPRSHSSRWHMPDA